LSLCAAKGGKIETLGDAYFLPLKIPIRP
jgi:hypothetical protein